MRKYVVTHKLGFLNWLLLPLHNFKIRIGITDKTKSDIRIQVRKEELKRGHRSISFSKVKET